MRGEYRSDHEPGDGHVLSQRASAGYDPPHVPPYAGPPPHGAPPGGPAGYGSPYAERTGPHGERLRPQGEYSEPYGEPPWFHGERPEPPGEPAGFYGESPEEESSLVRLYAVTGGRTVSSTRLAMEALVSSATSARLGLSYVREYRAISELCHQVRSVAEISALLGVPLGVARVLISDMESEGLVRVHHPHTDAGGPDLRLLERVLSGLHRL